MCIRDRSITGKEELVRAYLITRLVKELGYKPEDIEIEKEYDIGRPKVNKPRTTIPKSFFILRCYQKPLELTI